MNWRKLALWLVVAAVLAATFAAYLQPGSKVLLANLWAMCGF